MTTELMRYGRYRFLLYKKWDYARNMRTEKQQEALDAGKALFKAANIEHWASQPELVERVQKFLIDSFPSYRPSPYGESPKNIIDALCRELRNGDVVIVRAEPAYIAHDGFVPAREFDYEAYERDIAERASSYAARSKAYRDDLKAYNQEIDERIARESRALQKPFRHVETMAEAQARNIAARAASEKISALALSVVRVVSDVASILPSSGDNDACDLGDVTGIGGGSTPLGDAAPFEYSESATGNDVLSIAARGVSEAHEADCFAEYESELDFCNALAPSIGGARATALCKQNAFDRYQQCRGY
ncbi:hypothetical protein [Caballeronia sordidicola]|uniref:hypothetical protein n=1 Tax=Caballeronia sordidicola TaxID=196367 RepID=UPI00068D0B68|nr:hypothetical protein [Caballeronia sordidicola]